MSTNAIISFFSEDEDKPRSIIYRHADGYPEGVGIDLLVFINEIRKNYFHINSDCFDDPSYLAAKWVVYDAVRQQKYDAAKNRSYKAGDRFLEKYGLGLRELNQKQKIELKELMDKEYCSGEKVSKIHHLNFSEIGIINDLRNIDTNNNYEIICNGKPTILHNKKDLEETLKNKNDWQKMLKARESKGEEWFYFP